MHVFLRIDRLTLRCFTEADEDNLFELSSDPEVMRFLTGGAPTPRDVVQVGTFASAVPGDVGSAGRAMSCTS